jgi:hypothetical protein
MTELRDDIRIFTDARAQERAHAVQRAALQLLCGLDLGDVLAAGAKGRRDALRRIERAMARERLKGLSRHWSYDLNRHIALKQAADTIRAVSEPVACRSAPKRKAAPEGAAT